MIPIALNRYALSMSAVCALLAGCGAPQPIAATGPVPSNRLHQSSGSDGDLIYVATSKAVEFLPYPGGKVIGSLPYERASLCADPNNGNVFVTNGKIFEYAHGGTTPLSTLDLPPGYSDPRACTVDPTTGNLALLAYGSQFQVLVYSQAQGVPTVFPLPKPWQPYSVTYDNSGDLYVLVSYENGHDAIALLPAGQSQFDVIRIRHLARLVGEKIQWDGTYLSMISGDAGVIFQLQVQGTTGSVVGTTDLQEASRNPACWIQAGSVIGIFYKARPHNDQALAVWPYPSGGSPTARYYGITKGRKDGVYDLVVSVASTL